MENSKKIRVIGVGGVARAGKDTFVSILINLLSSPSLNLTSGQVSSLTDKLNNAIASMLEARRQGHGRGVEPLQHALLQRDLPKAPDGADLPLKIAFVIFRELPGIILMGIYFTVLPPAMVIMPPLSKMFRGMYLKMGFLRYMLLSNLLLMMALLPLKMVLRWTINLKYFIAIPEYLLNF